MFALLTGLMFLLDEWYRNCFLWFAFGAYCFDTGSYTIGYFVRALITAKAELRWLLTDSNASVLLHCVVSRV